MRSIADNGIIDHDTLSGSASLLGASLVDVQSILEVLDGQSAVVSNSNLDSIAVPSKRVGDLGIVPSHVLASVLDSTLGDIDGVGINGHAVLGRNLNGSNDAAVGILGGVLVVTNIVLDAAAGLTNNDSLHVFILRSEPTPVGVEGLIADLDVLVSSLIGVGSSGLTLSKLDLGLISTSGAVLLEGQSGVLSALGVNLVGSGQAGLVAESLTNVDEQSLALVLGLLGDNPDTVLGIEISDLDLLAVSINDGGAVQLPNVVEVSSLDVVILIGEHLANIEFLTGDIVNGGGSLAAEVGAVGSLIHELDILELTIEVAVVAVFIPLSGEQLALVLSQSSGDLGAGLDHLLLAVNEDLDSIVVVFDVVLNAAVGSIGNEDVVAHGSGVSSILDVDVADVLVGTEDIVDLSTVVLVSGQVLEGVGLVNVLILFVQLADDELGAVAQSVLGAALADHNVGIRVNGSTIDVVDISTREVHAAILVGLNEVQSHALVSGVGRTGGGNVSIFGGTAADELNIGVSVALAGLAALECSGEVAVELVVRVKVGNLLRVVFLGLEAVDLGNLDRLFLAVHVDEGGLCVVISAGDPEDVLQDSIVIIVDNSRTNQVAELVKEPSVLDSAGSTSSVEVELDGIQIIGLVNGVLAGLGPNAGLSALEGLSLGNDLNELALHSGLVVGQDDALGDLCILVDIDENIVALSIVITLDIELAGAALIALVVNIELHVSVAGNVVLAVGLLGNNLVDVSEIGVDHDQTIIAVLVLVELDLLALSADHSLGSSGLVGLKQSLGSGAVINAVDISLNDLGFLLLAESLADVALRSGNMERSVGSGNDGSILSGILLGIVLAVVVGVLGPDGGGTAPVVSTVTEDELEALVAEGGVGLDILVGLLVSGQADILITERGGVGHGRDLNGLEQELGDQLTGSGSAEVDALDVLQDLVLLGDLSDMQRPVSTGELVVLVVANSAEDHREDFITGDLAGGQEGAVGIALDQSGVGAVANVALGPAGAGHVRELVVGLIVLDVRILNVGGVDAVDDRSHLSTGDVTLGLESLTVVVALEDLHTSENVDGFGVGRVDILGIFKGCVGADSQRQSHDQSQHHCE